MKHIVVYQTTENATRVIINKRRHDNVTSASIRRLGNIVVTQQMLGNCDVTPNLTGKVGWTANIHS